MATVTASMKAVLSPPLVSRPLNDRVWLPADTVKDGVVYKA